jgi:hypothetical protein
MSRGPTRVIKLKSLDELAIWTAFELKEPRGKCGAHCGVLWDPQKLDSWGRAADSAGEDQGLQLF